MLWKRILALITLILLIGAILLIRSEKRNQETALGPSKTEIREGDLIFQTSLSSQSLAVQKATQSIYSHCGIIYKKGHNFFVLEAGATVKLTPLSQWIDSGKDSKYVIRRLKNAKEILNQATLLKMKTAGMQFVGKPYDSTFEWSDDRIYCSELIWKIYKKATTLELGKLQKLRDFDLTAESVKEKMMQRYGDRIPLNETVISPKAIFESNLLVTVVSN